MPSVANLFAISEMTNIRKNLNFQLFFEVRQRTEARNPKIFFF